MIKKNAIQLPIVFLVALLILSCGSKRTPITSEQGSLNSSSIKKVSSWRTLPTPYEIVNQVGTTDTPGSGFNQLRFPGNIEIMRNGNWLVADNANRRVIEINPDTKLIINQYGTTGVAGRGFNQIFAATDVKELPNGNWLIADGANYRVIEVNPFTKEVIRQYGGVKGRGPNQLEFPVSADVLPDGNWVIGDNDISPHRILVVNPTTKTIVREIISSPTSVIGEFSFPEIDVLPDGNWLIVDVTIGHRIIEFNPISNTIVKQYGRFPSDAEWGIIERTGIWLSDILINPGDADLLKEGNWVICHDMSIIVVNPITKEILMQFGKAVRGVTAIVRTDDIDQSVDVEVLPNGNFVISEVRRHRVIEIRPVGIPPVEIDTIPPTISQLTPAPSLEVDTAFPTISAVVMDNPGGSGIDPASIVIRVDNQIVFHSFNIDTGLVNYTPTVALSIGLHNVSLEVKDKVGNRASVSWSFKVTPIGALKGQIVMMKRLRDEIQASGIVISRSLVAKLDVAIESANRGVVSLEGRRGQPAINAINTTQNQLNALINEIGAQADKKISPMVAGDWTSNTQDIISELEKIKNYLISIS